MASTKFVKKINRKQTKAAETNVRNDEYFIPIKGVKRVQQFKDKVESMYDIHIEFEQEAEDGHWIVIEGEQLDRKNAKNYIKALTDPSEMKRIQFPSAACTEFTDPQTLQEIEKHTNAFIRPLKKIAQFEISGTELAVTLAMSQMEELSATAGVTDTSVDDNGVDADFITISPANQNASSRLSDQLQRALSEHSDGICSVDDYLQAPNSVKRVLVNCLHNDVDDIDDEMLFADGEPVDGKSSTKSSSLRIIDTSQDSKWKSASDISNGGTETDKSSPSVTTLSEKMDSCVMAEKPEVKFDSHQHKYLYDFGMTVGYKEGVVNEALKFVHDKTRPSDFLDLLNDASEKPKVSDSRASAENSDGEDVVIESTEEVFIENGKERIEAVSKEGAASSQSSQNKLPGGSSTLPAGYREKLLQDFFQEDDNCSIEELKRRNAERQQLLRENFLKEQKPDAQVGKKAGKGKGKNKKKKQNQQQVQVQTKGQNESHDLPHDKQFKLEHGRSNPGTADSEETCLMKVWSTDKTDPCANFVNITPKRKQSQPSQHQQTPQWSQMIPNTPPKKDGWLTPGAQHWNQYPPHQPWSPAGSGSPRPVTGSHFKPMQVVAPVSMDTETPGLQQGPSVPDKDDLRYIVIDGSNVAMTHGNGKFFSCKGLRLAVDYFKQRGHEHITVFVPQWRTYRPSNDNPIMDQHILEELKMEEILVFTPARRIGRKLVASYDDRFVLELAEAEDGIIVSNDQYRDLMSEKTSWRKLVEERLLMFTFAKDRFMPPSDPLGRDGPCLDDFLKKTQKRPGFNRQQNPGYKYNQQHQQQPYIPQQQPYQQQKHQQYTPNKNYHQQQQQQQQGYYQGQSSQGQGHYRTRHQQGNQYDQTDGQTQGQNFNQSFQKPVRGHQKGQGNPNVKGQGKWMACRSEDETEMLYSELKVMFPEPDQDEKIRTILANHEQETDLTKLTNYCMSVLF